MRQHVVPVFFGLLPRKHARQIPQADSGHPECNERDSSREEELLSRDRLDGPITENDILDEVQTPSLVLVPEPYVGRVKNALKAWIRYSWLQQNMTHSPESEQIQELCPIPIITSKQFVPKLHSLVIFRRGHTRD
jgi:hypothetical protein